MDYLVQAKIKNGRVFRAMRQMGMGSVADLAKAAGVTRSSIDALINLKSPARNQNGEWAKGALAIASALAYEPDDLFSDEQQWMSVKSNEVERYFSGEEIAAISGGIEADPALLIAENEFSALLEDVKDRTLTPREATVIRDRYEEDLTLEACARRHNVTSERIRQVEAKALRKLRGKSHQLK